VYPPAANSENLGISTWGLVYPPAANSLSQHPIWHLMYHCNIYRKVLFTQEIIIYSVSTPSGTWCIIVIIIIMIVIIYDDLHRKVLFTQEIIIYSVSTIIIIMIVIIYDDLHTPRGPWHSWLLPCRQKASCPRPVFMRRRIHVIILMYCYYWQYIINIRTTYWCGAPGEVTDNFFYFSSKSLRTGAPERCGQD
jgi:hypothetical protein